MGSCLRKTHSIGPIRGLSSDYDMGTHYTAQAKKVYLLGVHNDTNSNVQIHTLDLTIVSTFYSLRQVTGTSHAVSLSSRGYICGLEVEGTLDGQKKVTKHIAREAKVLEQATIVLKKGDVLRKVILGSSESAITGMQLFSETQKISLGSLDHSERVTELDYLDADIAIIGFDMYFGVDRLVELSVITAPTQKHVDIPMTKPYLNNSSFALVNEDFYEKMRDKQDQMMIKSVFKESKRYRQQQSM